MSLTSDSGSLSASYSDIRSRKVLIKQDVWCVWGHVLSLSLSSFASSSSFPTPWSSPSSFSCSSFSFSASLSHLCLSLSPSLPSSTSKELLMFSWSVVSDSLWPHGLQHARLPCPSPSPRVCSNSYPLSWWCHPTIQGITQSSATEDLALGSAAAESRGVEPGQWSQEALRWGEAPQGNSVPWLLPSPRLGYLSLCSCSLEVALGCWMN